MAEPNRRGPGMIRTLRLLRGEGFRIEAHVGRNAWPYFGLFDVLAIQRSRWGLLGAVLLSENETAVDWIARHRHDEALATWLAAGNQVELHAWRNARLERRIVCLACIFPTKRENVL